MTATTTKPTKTYKLWIAGPRYTERLHGEYATHEEAEAEWNKVHGLPGFPSASIEQPDGFRVRR